MQNFILALNKRFSDADKELCIPTIRKVVELANIARRKGILALEVEIAQEENFFLKTGIGMVADGICPEDVMAVLQNLILADDYIGADLLNRLIIAEGVLALQRGEIPHFIGLRLGAMLGEKYLPQFVALPTESVLRNYYEFLRGIKDKEALPASAAFEDWLLRSDHRSIQTVLQKTDSATWAQALRGCSAKAIEKILENVSQSVCLQLCEELSRPNNLSITSVLWAQRSISETIDRLENTGEIMVYRHL